MFDRFTDHAKRLFNRARQEAQRLDHDYLGTEHILLGLLNDQSGVAANALAKMKIDTNKIATQVQAAVKRGSNPPLESHVIPKSPKVLELGMEEAAGQRSRELNTGHFLVGLLLVKDSISSRVLEGCGIDVTKTRASIQGLTES
jgi:ATP-dependent Clp protease ATP-binding subunit ClpC